MSYRYEAAQGYQATRRTKPAPASPSSSHYRAAYSAPGPSVASYVEDHSARSTHERWQAAQAPTIHIQTDTRVKGVRFARPGESPLPAYLHLGSPTYSPVSPTSAYMPSPRAPSLSYSTDGEHDDLECPPTPEHISVPLPPVDAKPKHQASHTAINQIIYEMSSLVASFRCPTDLEFEPMSRDQSVPKLTFASKNRPLLEQNQKLENLQSRLDAVESHGDADVRKARKVAVGQVERALEDVKRMQVMAWNKRVYEQRKKRHT